MSIKVNVIKMILNQYSFIQVLSTSSVNLKPDYLNLTNAFSGQLLMFYQLKYLLLVY